MGHVPSNDYWGSQIPRLIDHGLHKRLTLRSVKLFVDGALGSWGAALIAPYNDKPDTRGLLCVPPQTLHKLVERFHDDDFQVVRVFFFGRNFVSRGADASVESSRTSTLLAIAQMRSRLTVSKTF
jgi:hypothetical protein